MTSIEKKAVREALESAGGALASLTMDVGADRKLAWVWHILNDWEEAFDEVADKCKWSPEDRERVKRYRQALAILDKSEGEYEIRKQHKREVAALLSELDEQDREIRKLKEALEKEAGNE